MHRTVHGLLMIPDMIDRTRTVCAARRVIIMKAERFVGDGLPDVPKRRDGVPKDSPSMVFVVDCNS